MGSSGDVIDKVRQAKEGLFEIVLALKDSKQNQFPVSIAISHLLLKKDDSQCGGLVDIVGLDRHFRSVDLHCTECDLDFQLQIGIISL